MRETLWAGHLQVAAENKRAGVTTRRSLYRWCNELFPLLYPPTREPRLPRCLYLLSPTAPNISSSSATSLSTLGRATSSTSIASLATNVTSTATTPLSEIDMSKLSFQPRTTSSPMANNCTPTPIPTIDSASDNDNDNHSTNTKELRIYLSRRAPWKSAWPSLLDCTAAGGLSSSDPSPLEGIIREAHEEVRLPSPYLRSHARYIGENRLQLCETEIGEEGCQMQVQHVFEVELPESITPRPGDGDGEVVGWELVDVGG
ncbi:hypothetical protein B0T21DRAFT_386811 [Apiosordaria backusii]|uniref:Nudix hydrolase domain-containing protein n=1 Tax=Apiosordaria backusii TaxID=314023 RepID=A0AA40AIL7_9PEZI|nr:hypothetical protein B0T21DRAFT_386811 [Apiosordaria backusii]